jgi:toxin-antitoxin system PIN domain toxin
MLLLDVNVLVYAHREDAPNHRAYHEWLVRALEGPGAFGLCDLVLSGFLRVVTHRKVFDPPSSLKSAVTFVTQLRERPNRVRIEPGERHWPIFVSLCTTIGARGNLIPDAWLAALAIESGSEWITTDRDFSRFPGLRWRHPLEA